MQRTAAGRRRSGSRDSPSSCAVLRGCRRRRVRDGAARRYERRRTETEQEATRRPTPGAAARHALARTLGGGRRDVAHVGPRDKQTRRGRHACGPTCGSGCSSRRGTCRSRPSSPAPPRPRDPRCLSAPRRQPPPPAFCPARPRAVSPAPGLPEAPPAAGAGQHRPAPTALSQPLEPAHEAATAARIPADHGACTSALGSHGTYTRQ